MPHAAVTRGGAIHSGTWTLTSKNEAVLRVANIQLVERSQGPCM
jgi:hypothetical protein